MVFGGGENLQDCRALTCHAYTTVPEDALQFRNAILVLFHERTLAKRGKFENS
ncbi:hypothetical protein D3C87_2185380 [compost metagenome]